MFKRLGLLIIFSPFTYAADIYETPSADSTIISSIDSDHEYTIKTQDWVEITDRTTNKKGWAKLSEVKQGLSQNSHWSYQWHTTSKGSQQTMHYKPFSEADFNKQIKKVHQQHKKIMNAFETFWDDLEEDTDLA